MNHATTLGMILEVARARGTAPASAIRVHSSIADKIRREDGPAALDSCGITVELDNSLPVFPGFAIERMSA